uniref:E3 ubiquitin-protein ligase n=1 Tax=Hadrurus spadix TaxID=141984 RepID=A0A1W7R9B1_9SCOR
MDTIDEMQDSVMLPSTFHNDLDFRIHDWMKKFECKTLDANDIRSYWAQYVPAIYSPPVDCNCLNLTYDEKKAERLLFTPLERLVTHSNDPQKVFEEIRNVERPPTLCGRVFKAGEPTYSCRDCGLDPTCVLCVDCFKNSAHKMHRYKMSMSGGGGYCDCGDEGAWKAHAFCEVHLQAKIQANDGSTPMDKLPADLVDRMRFIMETVLHYCFQMLTWEHAINLPADLQPQKKSDESTTIYATVLFNDEVHTYEQVIQTLGRAIGCNQKEATDFATVIDREGRCIVKCSNFTACNQVRHIIERVTSRHGSQPLKVIVMHTDVLAHQIFAMRLLSWLQQILSHSEGFRIIFSRVMMLPVASDSPLLENVLLSDTQLWKTARNQWHQLFISGMLMEQQCKKTFAKVFTKNYPVLVKDFIADDHEHAMSITSLSVQVFTLPLAHTLIREENAMSVLLKTFLTECERNRNEDGKLAFERNHTNPSFRRAQYVLYDVKYLLTVTPDQWVDAMRKNFLNGTQSLLILLNWMQGMDSVVRQVGQHVEFEAEWETGINLQLKLAPVITLTLKWCGSDRSVLIKALRAAQRHFVTLQDKMVCVDREILGHSASCIDYDVSSMPVTVHIPLSRFIAGLLLHLEKYGLTYHSPEFENKSSPKQLMELPLRTLVMMAQFRAGMWRRNGYSLLNQVYFYHNVRLRDEMYDRDIMMMQIAASMMESNEFMVHLLNKFSLLNWVDEYYDAPHRKTEDDVTRQTVTVAEEFLGLILTIVSERHTPGIGNVSEADRIKKEIIQLLCVESMPHSQLFKLLPKDPNHETGMEEVINEVAAFRKPQGSATGKYELKPEFYKDFNPFYYHYTREDQSRAEEVQLKRRRTASEDECCPPPVPPEFCSNFCTVINILQCDIMLHVTKLVLKRTINLQSGAYTETQFEKILHLIGVGLQEEQRVLDGSASNTAFTYVDKATKSEILQCLEECMNCPRIEAQKDLLKWTIRKFKYVQNLRTKGETNVVEMEEGTSDSQVGETSKKDRKRNAELAAARKARIMAQMSAMQKNFIREHAELFKEAELEELSMSDSQVDITSELHTENPIAVGNYQRGRNVSIQVFTCILCREDQEVTLAGPALVLAAFVQRSTVLSKNRKHALNDADNYDPLLVPADLFSGPHTTTCGHVMHSDCWQKFFDSVLKKERRRPLRFGRHISFDVDKNEFLCPLCECLSNSVIPLVPAISSLVPADSCKSVEILIDDWILAMHKAVEKVYVQQVEDPSADADSGEKFINHFKPASLEEIAPILNTHVAEQFTSLFDCYRLPSESREAVFSESLLEMMKNFSQATYIIGLNLHPHPDDDRVPLTAWWSCSYTIHAIEWLLRDQGKPLFGELSSRNSNCLQAIVRFVTSSLQVFDPQTVRSHGVRLLRFLILSENHLYSSQCCLEVDAFSLLVSLALSTPNLFGNDEGKSATKPVPLPLGSILDQHLLHVVYVFHLVQLLLTYTYPDDEAMETDSIEDIQDSEETIAFHFFKEVMYAAGLAQNKTLPSGIQIVQSIHEGMLPFLRCCALFYHYVTDITPPQQLQQLDSNEYQHLCHYLGLPIHISEILHSSSLKQLALNWARHPRILHLLNIRNRSKTPEPSSEPPTDSLVVHPLSVNQLVELPSDYSELINGVSLFTCPNSDGDDSRSPTMCLVCGEILCSQSYCCQTELENDRVGACTYHAHFCGAEVGVFLRIRDCKILLLARKTKGCYMPPPYVDDYGETDQGLVRGNPLHLCHERYKELHRLWLNHGIPEQIAHVLEQSTSLSVTNWQLL